MIFFLNILIIIVNIKYHSKSIFKQKGFLIKKNINVNKFYQEVIIYKIKKEL